MARKRSRIAGMKMPFVVTMSVAASACGGTFMDTQRDNVETGGTGGDDPGSTGGTNPGTGGHESGGAGGWSTGGAGGWTTGGAGGIDWGGAGGVGAGGSGGGWGGAGGSNPPPPNMCPVDAPPSGGPCVAAGAPWPTICRYPGNAPCMSDRTFACTNGTWVESVTYLPTCNPPPPPPPVTCPAIEPTPYTDSCRGPGGNYYTGPDCGYGDCAGQPVRFWKCTPIWEGVMILDYVWSQSAVASCNPPPPYPSTGGAPAYDAGAAIPPNP